MLILSSLWGCLVQELKTYEQLDLTLDLSHLPLKNF